MRLERRNGNDLLAATYSFFLHNIRIAAVAPTLGLGTDYVVLLVQRILHEQLPIALLYQRPELDAFTGRLRNQTPSLSTIWWNAGAWELGP